MLEFREQPLQLGVDLPRAADPTNGAGPNAPLVDRLAGSFHDPWVIGEAEVVVARKVDELLSIHPPPARGWGLQNLRHLVEVLILQGLELLLEKVLERRIHAPSLVHQVTPSDRKSTRLNSSH